MEKLPVTVRDRRFRRTIRKLLWMLVSGYGPMAASVSTNPGSASDVGPATAPPAPQRHPAPGGRPRLELVPTPRSATRRG